MISTGAAHFWPFKFETFASFSILFLAFFSALTIVD